jgi:hypothetical protein
LAALSISLDLVSHGLSNHLEKAAGTDNGVGEGAVECEGLESTFNTHRVPLRGVPIHLFLVGRPVRTVT